MNFLDILGIKKAILQAFEDVMVKFSFWISRMVYPMIADFYDIFDILARHRFFTDDTIRKISNNIYILISVIMLFAFSIKLITAIVNPDSLTDKKKGFTGLFMRSLIGILLIVFIPWGFQMAYELQDKLLDKSIIQKLVLGDKAAYSTNGGDVIAGATLSTFLQPTGVATSAEMQQALASQETFEKIIDTNELDNENINEVLSPYNIENLSCPSDMTVADFKNVLAYENTVDDSGDFDESILTDNNKKYKEDANMEDFMSFCSEPFLSVYNNRTETINDSGSCESKYENMIVDINKIDNFKKCITKRDISDKYIYSYNGILAPIAGIFMAYEMLVLCIDIALRSIKLGLLELIAPVIICGYIYSGEVIKKWLKEVVATYVLVFVKLAVVSFLIVGLTTLPDFLNNSDFASHKLLIKLLIIIGLLQLVKQLPNLINSIFGIEIKSQGGIKGRLGEMAGVGKMAQDAWSKLGGKAKGLGKTLALAPVGAAGAGLKKGWKNLAQKDSLAGNFAARVNQAMNGKTGRVLRTLKAGVNSNGKGTGKALMEAWNKDAETISARRNEMNQASLERNRKLNMNDAGTGTKFKDDKLNSPFDASNVFLKDANGKDITIKDSEGKDIKVNKNNINEYLQRLTKNSGESDEAFAKRKDSEVKKMNDLIRKARIEYDQGKKKQLTADVEGIVNDVKMNSGISASGQKYFDDFKKATENKERMDAAKSNQDKMLSILETARNNAMDDNVRRNIEEMIGTVKSNSFYNKSVDEQLAAFDKLQSENGNIIDSGSFNKLKEFNIKFNSQTQGLSAKGATAIGDLVKTRTTEAENATKVLDAYKDNLKSESTKTEIDEYKNMISVKTKESIATESDIAYFSGKADKMDANGNRAFDSQGNAIIADIYSGGTAFDTLKVKIAESNSINTSTPSSNSTQTSESSTTPDSTSSQSLHGTTASAPTFDNLSADAFDSWVNNFDNVNSNSGKSNGTGDSVVNQTVINNNVVNNLSGESTSSNQGESTESDTSNTSPSSIASVDDITKAVTDAVKAENKDKNDNTSDKLDAIQKSVENVHSTIKNNDIEMNNSLDNIDKHISDSTSDIGKDIKDLKKDDDE